MQLSNHVKLTKLQDHTAAGTSDVTSDILDMQGYDGVMFFTSFGTAAAANTIKAQQGAAANMSDAADLLGTSVSSGTTDEDVWLDIFRPQERYMRIVAARGTSSTLESIWALQYEARVLPISNVLAGTIIGEKHISPAEGTA